MLFQKPVLQSVKEETQLISVKNTTDKYEKKFEPT